MTRTVRVSVVLASMAVAGCVAGPKLGDLRPHLIALPADKSRIYFFEADRQGGALVNPSVHVEGRAVGVCMPRSVFFIEVAPGQHRAHASNKKAHSPTMEGEDIVISTKAGEEAFVLCRVKKGIAIGRSGAYIGIGELELVDVARGRAAVEPLAFIGSATQIGAPE